MKAKNILVVLVAAMTLFTEGCSLMDLFGGMGMQPPLGPLGQVPGLPPGQGPLDGSLNGGLPPFAPGPVAAAPGATPTAPTAPTSPDSTPVPNPAGTPTGITPPSPVIPAASGTAPSRRHGQGQLRRHE